MLNYSTSTKSFSTGPLVAALTERFGGRVVVGVGALLACVGFAASFPAASLLHLVLTIGFVAGTVCSFVYFF